MAGYAHACVLIYKRCVYTENAYQDGGHFEVVNNKKKIVLAKVILQLPENVALHFHTRQWVEIDFFLIRLSLKVGYPFKRSAELNNDSTFSSC